MSWGFSFPSCSGFVRGRAVALSPVPLFVLFSWYASLVGKAMTVVAPVGSGRSLIPDVKEIVESGTNAQQTGVGVMFGVMFVAFRNFE